MDRDKQRFINWRKSLASDNNEGKIPTLMETLIELKEKIRYHKSGLVEVPFGGSSSYHKKTSRSIKGFHEVLTQQMDSQKSVIVVSHVGALKTLTSWLGVGTHSCIFAFVHRRRVMFAVRTCSMDLLVDGLDIKGRNVLNCACTGCGSVLCASSTQLKESLAIRCPLCKRNYCLKCSKESWRVVEGALTCGNCRKEAAKVKAGIEANVSGVNKRTKRKGRVSDEDESDEEDDSSDAFDSDDEECQMLSRVSAQKPNEDKPNEDTHEENRHAFDDEAEAIEDTLYTFMRLTEFCDLSDALDDKAIGRRLFQKSPKTRPDMFCHLNGWLKQMLEDPPGSTGELYVMGFRGNRAGDIVSSQSCQMYRLRWNEKKRKAVFQDGGSESLLHQINGGHLIIVGFILRLYPAERVSEAFAVLSEIETRAAMWDSLSEFREVTMNVPWEQLLSHNLHTYTDDVDPYA
eukprot:449649_1